MDDFYNDSFGDQCLMELDIINTVSTVTDTISEPVSPAKNITVNNQLPEENTPSIPRIPDHFIDFPYPKPYTQQLELMQTVYKTLETTSCGVFESPTGTGKSLSLLTASLRWLLDYNTKQLMRLDHLQGQMKSMTTSNDNNKENNNTTVDDWIKDFEVNRQLKRQIEPQIEDLIVYQSSLQLIEKIKLTKTPSSSLSALQLTDPPSKVKQPESTSETVDVEKLENFIKVTNEEDCDALDADDDLFLCEQKPEVEQFKLLEDIDELNASENEFDQYSKIKQQPDNGLLRIIYCSRTHSQLGQIAKEFNKCKSLFDKVTMIQLSSRYLLCTNQQVYELKHSDLINIACLELNRPRNRDEKQIKKFKCPMHNLSAINNLANYLLVGSSSAMDVTSIIRNNQETKPSRTLKPMNSNKNSLNNRRKDHTEDLQLLDSHIGCPYYANRKGIPLAQLILVPYSLLLQSSSRSTSGLKLKNSIIIIDEAHNLLDAMASSMSVNLLLINDLYRLEELFTDYLNYYRSRLSTFLALRLRQMKHFLHQLKAYLNNIHKNMLKTSMSADSFMMTSSNNIIIKTVNQLYSESNLDNINVSEFIDCLEYQHFIMKLIGFSKWSNRRIKQTNSSSNSQLTNILASMKRKYPGDDKRQLEDVNQVNIANKRCKMDIEKSEGIGSSLFKFHRFLQALAQCEEDARIVIELFKNSTKADDIKTSESGLPTSSNVNNTKDNQDLCISIIFLNPGRYLKELVQEARCVLLVGGTMQPFTEAIEQIFLPAGKLTSQIVTFACDHVIDAKTQLAVYPLGENCQTDGKVLSLDFTYQPGLLSLLLLMSISQFYISIGRLQVY
uniref:Helicase ATP-binding domain-containing protein n=1 Tax=Trichobilharzia regenti TaxID=157069 RepID=A0AA85KAT2_TRIRE|nr:unnamed protein product [Trichobilharzia regenti]